MQGFVAFVPNAMVYYFVCVHFTSLRRIQAIALVFLLVCVFVIAHGAMDLYQGVPEANPRQTDLADGGVQGWNEEHPYLFAMRNDAGQWFFRLRGLGPINDPNDFGQIEVCTIPLMFLFWRAKKWVRNFTVRCFAGSRAADWDFFNALAGRVAGPYDFGNRLRRGVVLAPCRPSLSGADYYWRRWPFNSRAVEGISAEAGADRTVLWGEDLALLKSHPLFGVGFGRMAEHTQLTAHNSIVVCAAELGLFGLYFWSMFLFATVRDA